MTFELAFDSGFFASVDFAGDAVLDSGFKFLVSFLLTPFVFALPPGRLLGAPPPIDRTVGLQSRPSSEEVRNDFLMHAGLPCNSA